MRTDRHPAEALLETSTDAFVVLDRGAAVLYANASAERYASRLAGGGRAPGPLRGRALWDAVPALAGSALEQACLRALRDGREAVFEYTHADGGPVLVVQAHPSEDGLALCLRDVTTARRREEMRARRAQQQALVADLGLSALAGDDLQATLDDAAAVVAHTLDLPVSTIDEIAPDGSLRARAGLGDAPGPMAAGAVIRDGPAIRGDLDGYAVLIPGRHEPFGLLGVFGRSGRGFSSDDVLFLRTVANVLGAAVDRAQSDRRLTEVRERERRRIARDLHDEALQELTFAAVRASRADRDPDDLAVTLQRVADHLRAAIYDLRLDAERDRPFPELMHSLIDVHRPRAAERGAELTLEVGDDVPGELLDERAAEILRIVGEALTNAWRHAEASHVSVSVQEVGERLRVEVRDDGAGFDPVTVDGGSGLGGMHERAELIEAEIDVASNPGDGTRVRLELFPVSGPAGHVGPARVLLVEDHVGVRQALARAFERAGAFRVVGEASTLAEARRLLRGVDVAVLDLGLPDGDGSTLIADLQRASRRAQALVLSASLDRSDMARAVHNGAGAVLHKTAHLDEVVMAVRRLHAGEAVMPPEEVIELLRFAGREREREWDAQRAVAELTPRELEVVQLLADGLDAAAIADRLHITARTQRNHVAHILTKLGVHSQLQAVLFCLRHGVVRLR